MLAAVAVHYDRCHVNLNLYHSAKVKQQFATVGETTCTDWVPQLGASMLCNAYYTAVQPADLSWSFRLGGCNATFTLRLKQSDAPDILAHLTT